MEKVICEPDFPIVETTKGKLHGYLRNEVYHFLGIEYGKAQRFQMPEMAPPWDGVRDAKSYGYVCPLMPGQEGENPIEHAFERPHRYWPMSENCLSLNIWTKRIQKASKDRSWYGFMEAALRRDLRLNSRLTMGIISVIMGMLSLSR